MVSYITPHHSGGWRYQHHIPKPLRSLLGGKTAIVRYLKRCPCREAEAKAREWAVKDAKVLAKCWQVPEEERAALAAFGGLLALLNNPAIPTSQLDERYAKLQNCELFWRRLQAEAIVGEVDKEPELAVSWDALLAQWVRIKAPRHTRGHALTICLLKDHFEGTTDCRQITPSEIGQFRDKLTSQGVSREMVAIHLQRIHAMFAAACREPTSPFAGRTNPAAAVPAMLGKKPPRKDGSDKVLTPIEVRTILETATRVRFGKKRHEKVLWSLRLIAFLGPRPNEIYQLQGGDVYELNGVKLIHIRDTDAVTGQPHPQKFVKNGEPRMVPLHPDVMDFFDYAAKFATDEFIFGDFRWNKDNGRAAYLIDEFPRFLRHDCKIVDPTRRLKLYSLRHTVKTRMRLGKVPKEYSDKLLGHGKDISDRYGGGAEELPLLAEYVARVNYRD